MSGPARELALEGVWNARDLGGLPVAGGGHTRRGRIFRSGTLWFATPADCASLDALRLYTLIDLRLPQEEVREGNWVAELLDYRYHDLPVEVPGDPGRISLVHDGGAEHYVRLLEHNAGNLVRALRVISDPYNHPLVFHCTAGTDATSVLAALVASLLDVEPEAVVADHLAGDRGVRRIVRTYRGHAFYGAAAARADGLGADAATMIGFLDALGGTAGLTKWTLAAGLSEQELARLRAALVER